MSAKAQAYVWDESPQHGDALVLLLALADNADDEGMSPLHVEHLVKMTRQTVEVVEQLLDHLSASGDITIEKSSRPVAAAGYEYTAFIIMNADKFAQENDDGE